MFEKKKLASNFFKNKFFFSKILVYNPCNLTPILCSKFEIFYESPYLFNKTLYKTRGRGGGGHKDIKLSHRKNHLLPSTNPILTQGKLSSDQYRLFLDTLNIM